MIKSSKKNHIKQLLSICLSFIILLPSAMFCFAAETITLTTSNIVTYPTAEYINNGAIYFGQKVGDAISFSGGEVQYNGETVPGHFEPVDMNTVPTSTGTQRADIKFIPDDTTLYSGFEYKRCRYVTYTVSKTTPVFVDAENDPLVASEVEAGAKLSTSILSGGKMVNPYNADEAKIAARSWEWSNPDTVINESGYYEAIFVPVGYEKTTVQVYVKIASDVPETEILENPTISDFVYDENLTWKDVKINGGKAVIKGTETIVEGVFSVADNVKDWVPTVGLNNVPVVFTPYDAEVALPYSFNIPVTVNALPISFGEDYKGTTIDDPFEVEVTYGSKVSGVLSAAKKHLNYPTPSVVMIEDENSLAENGKVYKVSVLNYSNSNYTGTYAYVKATFKTTEISSEIKSVIGSGLNKFFVDCGSYSPMGTFTVYCNGEEIAEVKRGVAFDCEVYSDAGGTYEITAKYNPIENDYFIVSDALWSITVAPVRHIKVANTSSMPFKVNGYSGHTATIRTGDTIVMEYTMPEFAYWVIKDGNGKTVELDGVDVNEKKITFTMPDYDLKFSVKTPAQLEQEEAEANCDHLCHSDNAFYQVLWNILSIIFRLFNIQQYCDCGAMHYDAPIFGFIS